MLQIIAMNGAISLVKDNGIDKIMKDGEMYYLTGEPYSNRYKAHRLTPKQMTVVDDLIARSLSQLNNTTTTTTTPAQSAQVCEPQPQQSTANSVGNVANNANASEAINAIMRLLNGSNNADVNALIESAKSELRTEFVGQIESIAKSAVMRTEIKIASRPTTTINGTTAKYYNDALTMLANGINVYLYGAAGCGKSHTARQLADALGVEFYPSNQISFAHELNGFVDANGNYQETPLYRSLKNENGGLYFLDEFDASDPCAGLILNDLLANGYHTFANGEKVMRRDNWYCLTAGNTIGRGANDEYTGRAQLDASTLDRFAVVECGYDTRVELAICNNNSELVDFIHDIRASIASANIGIPVTYRAISSIDTLERAGMSLKKAINAVIFKGLATDDIRTITAHMTAVTNKYYRAI